MTKYALAGNPNCGKTTLFNRLTRSHQHVGNWAGVTVEHKVGKYAADKSIEIVDLPGIYSLSPLSPDEIVSRDYLLTQAPDLVIDVIDATNLDRNLYLANQLLALDYPIVLALNMADEARARGIEIDVARLSERFGCPVVPISASRNEGIDRLMQVCRETCASAQRHRDLQLDEQTELALAQADAALPQEGIAHRRWYAFKTLENDEKMLQRLPLTQAQTAECAAVSERYADLARERADIAIANARYLAIDGAVRETVRLTENKRLSLSDRIDRIVTGKWTGIPIFALVMFAVFFLSVQVFGTWTVDGLTALLEKGQEALADKMAQGQVATWLSSLVVDGIIAGVGGILVYVPQIMVLFGLISALEACGYMSRIAFLLDRVFRAIGLSGQSLIPMIVGCGCSVPGIMSARVVKNDAERRATVFLVPFVPCSAKLVMFAFFAGAVFNNNAFVATSMYFVSIAVIVATGLIFLAFRKRKGVENDGFVMELPPYRVPKVGNVLHEMWEKGKSFVIKAGTVIFVASIVLWFLRSFTWRMQFTEDMSASILAGLGRVVAPLFVPLGFGQWQYAVATLSGLAAKETVVVTLELVGGAQMSAGSAYAFMVFNLLCFPCMGAIATSFRELGSAKYGFAALGFQILTAYVTAMAFYWLSRLLGASPAAFWTLVTLLCLAIACAISYRLYRMQRRRKRCGSCAGNCAECFYNRNRVSGPPAEDPDTAAQVVADEDAGDASASPTQTRQESQTTKKDGD